MRKKYFIAGFLMLIILAAIYYFLGGFNEIKIQLVHAENYVVAGKVYQGPFKEDVLKAYFFEMKTYVEKKNPEGTVSVVNYELDYASSDSIDQLIGVLVNTASFRPENIPNLHIDTLMAQKAVRAIVRAHPLVMPRPDQVMDRIKAYAKENTLSLRGYAIEQYVKDDEIWTDVPLVEKQD